MDWTILWWLLAALIVIAGLAGTVVPALPGVPLVFVGLAIVLLVNTLIEAPRDSLIGMGILSAGIPLYFFWSRAK